MIPEPSDGFIVVVRYVNEGLGLIPYERQGRSEPYRPGEAAWFRETADDGDGFPPITWRDVLDGATRLWILGDPIDLTGETT